MVPPFCVIVHSNGLLEEAPGGRMPHGAADPRVIDVLREGLQGFCHCFCF